MWYEFYYRYIVYAKLLSKLIFTYISFASEIILSTEPRVLVSEFSTQLRHFFKISMTVSSYSNWVTCKWCNEWIDLYC